MKGLQGGEGEAGAKQREQDCVFVASGEAAPPTSPLWPHGDTSLSPPLESGL